MTNPTSNFSHSNPPDLTISLLQGPDEPDIPYAQRVYRAGWEAGIAACSAHPPAITGRPPRPDECDSKGRVWIWSNGRATDQPEWCLQHHAAVIEVLRFEVERERLGNPPRYPLRWRPAASLPVEGEHTDV